MANRYWVGGSGTWDSTAGSKWSTTSGGSGGAAVPTSSDDVFFDANSGSVTITQSGSRTCRNFNHTGFTGTFTSSGSATLVVTGDITLSSSATYSGVFSLQIDGDCNYTSNGAVFSSFSTSFLDGIITFQDDTQFGSELSGSITHQGTASVDLNGNDLRCFNFTSGGSNSRELSLNNGSLTVLNQLSLSGTNLTLNDANGEYRFARTTGTLTSTLTLSGTIVVEQRCVFSIANSPTLNGGLSLVVPGCRLVLASDITLDEDFIFVNQIIDGLWSVITPNIVGTQRSIIQTTGTRIFENFALQDISFTGGASFIGENCIDLGNVAGIDIQQPTNIPIVPRGEDYFLYAETTGPTEDNPFGTSTED